MVVAPGRRSPSVVLRMDRVRVDRKSARMNAVRRLRRKSTREDVAGVISDRRLRVDSKHAD